MAETTPPEYRSSNSVAKRPTLFLDVNDPRAKRGKLGMVQGRSGVEIQLVNTDAGMSVAALQSNYGVTSGQINAIEDQHAPITGEQIAAQINAITGTIAAPDGITNLVAIWVGSTLELTWTFDATASTNKYVSGFYIKFTQGTVNTGVIQHTINLTSSNQGYNLTQGANSAIFGIPQTSFDAITVYAQDVYGNNGASETITSPIYDSGLPVPYIVATSVISGYSISTTYIGNTAPFNGTAVAPPTLPTSANFNYVDIEEYVDTAGTIVSGSDPTNVPLSALTGKTFTQVSLSKLNPATIFTSTTDTRYVRAKFTDSLGAGTGTYSNIYKVAPSPVAVVNTKAPTDVASVTGTFSTGSNGDGAGNDVLITATIPTDGNAGNSFIVKLVPKAAPTISGSFYFYPSSITIPQKFVVNAADIYAQFGTYYGSYTGYVISVSSVGNKSSGDGTAIPEFTRTNALAGVTPTFSVVPTANGYIVTWSDYSGATKADIYESAISWVANPSDESSRVYSGSSPITIQSLNYTPRYILLRLYDNYGNASNYSALPGLSVTPYDPGTISLISNPVKFSTDGSIVAGNNASSGARALINQTGIYVYDAAGAPTTQIIGNATSGATTFITKKAEIADWSITSSHLQNDLTAGTYASGYVGLSGSNPNYTFWAGAEASDNSTGIANFSVTPAGRVTAKNIQIVGGQLDIGASSSNLTTGFHVTSSGVMYATGAYIGGTITASGGSFTGNVQLNGGSLYAGSSPSSGARVVINSNGLSAYDAGNGAQTTSISTNAANGAPTFTTSAATIGNFTIDSSTIHNSASTLVLTSTTTPGDRFIIKDASSVYQLGLAIPSTASDKILYAGSIGNPNFYVTADGKLNAAGATLKSGGTSAYVKIDGSTDTLSIYGLPSSNPGSSLAYFANIYGGSISTISQSSPISTTTPYTISMNSGGFSSDAYATFTVGTGSSSTGAFQVFGKSSNYPMLSIDPSGNSTSMTDSGVVGMTGSFASIGTTNTFINSSSVILGNGATGNSFVYINGYSRIRNATPVSSATGSYIRNTYIHPTSDGTPSSSTGFVGDIWISY